MDTLWSAVLSPADIKVERDKRQRRELWGIDELAESIQRRGQLQPIVVTRDLTLIAGERRLTAIRKLATEEPDRNWQVKVVFSDELDPAELRAIEFEENAKRVDLPWQDICFAILEYHQYKLSINPNWSDKQTGEALGLSAGTVSDRLLVARELKKGSSLVVDAPKYSTAVGIARRALERQQAAETSMLLSMATTAAKPAKAPKAASAAPDQIDIEELIEEAEDNLSALSSGTGYILNEDFSVWAPLYRGPKFNLIHCDFPYGVGMHKSDQGSGDSYGTYEDTPEIYWALVDTLLNYLDNFCEPSAHLVFWFPMDHYQSTLDRLSTKFRVNPYPLVWHKSDGAGIIPDANRGPRRTYETAFLASRGDRKIVRAVTNSVAAGITRGRHMSEKSQDVLRHFFRMLVDDSSSVLDPTCGSGSAIRAAVATGAGRYLGLELNPEFASHADEVLRQFLEDQEKPGE